MAIQEGDIEQHVMSLSGIGNLGSRIRDGFTRASYSPEETAAHEYIREHGESAGLVSRVDDIGNLFLRTPDGADEVIQFGSHLDTVRTGGLFDGGAGIVAGLEAIKFAMVEGLPTGVGLELVVWRGEESDSYRKPYKGSKGAFGDEFDVNILAQSFEIYPGTFRTLAQTLMDGGFDPSVFGEGRPTISQRERDNIRAHIELHIEQANGLETDGLDIGVVTGIKGNFRTVVDVEGTYAHSGATPPQDRYRRDVNKAIGYMIVAMDGVQEDYLGRGLDVVQTVGSLNSDRNHATNDRIYQNGLTKVSGFGYFSLDVRAIEGGLLGDFSRDLREAILESAANKNVGVSFTELGTEAPVPDLDVNVIDSLEGACLDLGYSHRRMSSGAGHDAAVVAKQTRSDGSNIPVGMVFIPCEEGISHDRREFTTNEAIARGANVLAHAIYKIAS